MVPPSTSSCFLTVEMMWTAAQVPVAMTSHHIPPRTEGQDDECLFLSVISAGCFVVVRKGIQKDVFLSLKTPEQVMGEVTAIF